MLASAGAVAAAVVTTHLGLTGTIIGTALAPMILILVKELGRDPVDRASRTAGTVRAAARRTARPPLERVRWPTVALTTVLAFAVAVTVITVPELAIGDSIGGERRLTFAAPEGGGGGGTPATTTPTTTTEEAPATTTAEPQPDPEPPETEPAQPAPAGAAPSPVAPDSGDAPAPGTEEAPVEPPAGDQTEGTTTSPPG
jgi:hypothetical protein